MLRDTSHIRLREGSPGKSPRLSTTSRDCGGSVNHFTAASVTIAKGGNKCPSIGKWINANVVLT
jgi:hypothetical protein